MTLDAVLLKVEATVQRLGLLSALVLLPLLIAVRCVEVLLRNLGTLVSLPQLPPASLFNAMESELFMLFAFLCIGAAYVTDSHVRVDILRDRWSPRTRAVVEILGASLLFLPFTAVVFWFGYDLVYSAWSHGERAALGFGKPIRWLLLATLPLGVALFATAVIARLLRNILFLRGLADDPNRQGAVR